MFGLDTNLYFRDAWSFEGIWARVFEPDDPASADLRSGRLDYDDDRYGATVKFIEIGENFDPGIGFVRRAGIRKTYLSGRVSRRPRVSWIRQLHLTGNLNRTANLEEVLETDRRQVDLRATLESGDELSVEFSDQVEFTNTDFAIGEVLIAPGEYPFRRYQIQLNTYRRRYASINTSYEFGGFWGGTRKLWSLGGNYRMNRNFGVRGNYSYNRLRLPGGELDTHLVSTRMRLALRNDLVFLGLFQYNDASGELASNVRFNWIPKPGTDLFVVYNELDEWSEMFFVKNRSLSLKLNYLFRL